MKINNIISKRFSKLTKLSIFLLGASIFIIGCTKVDTVKNESKYTEANVYYKQCEDEFHQKTKNKKQESKYKYEYLAKLDDMDEEISEAKSSIVKEESVYSQIDTEKDKFEEWDNMLNEIYCLLTTELNQKEFKALKDKQAEWLNYRERTAQADYDNFEGMVFANVQYNLTLAKITKERCYELVNNYL